MPLYEVVFERTMLVAADDENHAYSVAREFESESCRDYDADLVSINQIKAAKDIPKYWRNCIPYGSYDDSRVESFVPADNSDSNSLPEKAVEEYKAPVVDTIITTNRLMPVVDKSEVALLQQQLDQAESNELLDLFSSMPKTVVVNLNGVSTAILATGSISYEELSHRAGIHPDHTPTVVYSLPGTNINGTVTRGKSAPLAEGAIYNVVITGAA